MRRLKNIFFFLLLGVIALHAQDKPAAAQPAKPTAEAWHEKSASARIRFTVFSKRSPVIFVPVPTELADAQHVPYQSLISSVLFSLANIDESKKG